jgi:anti-sigma B factor antagonist
MLKPVGTTPGAGRGPDQIQVGEDTGGVAVLALSGELDILRTPRLRVAINEALRARPAALVIDLCEVSFVDSTALALLLNAQRRATHQGIVMELVCDVARTLELLSLTRLDREFEIHATRPGALAAARSAVA